MQYHTYPGDLVLLASKWKEVREEERQLAKEVHQALRKHSEAGVNESQLARYAKVDRMTVRRALGKMN